MFIAIFVEQSGLSLQSFVPLLLGLGLPIVYFQAFRDLADRKL